MKRANVSGAFSLVEVALAVGVAAVTLTAIFALLPATSNTVRNALSQETAANILAAVYADMKGTPNTATTSPQFGIQFGSNTTIYFDDAAQISDGTKGAYRVTITFPTVSIPTEAVVANLRATWPANADPANPTGGATECSVGFDRD